jgi:hypothetical protein
MPLKPLTREANRAGMRVAAAVFVATAVGYAGMLPLLPERGRWWARGRLWVGGI